MRTSAASTVSTVPSAVRTSNAPISFRPQVTAARRARFFGDPDCGSIPHGGRALPSIEHFPVLPLLENMIAVLKILQEADEKLPARHKAAGHFIQACSLVLQIRRNASFVNIDADPDNRGWLSPPPGPVSSRMPAHFFAGKQHIVGPFDVDVRGRTRFCRKKSFSVSTRATEATCVSRGQTCDGCFGRTTRVKYKPRPGRRKPVCPFLPLPRGLLFRKYQGSAGAPCCAIFERFFVGGFDAQKSVDAQPVPGDRRRFLLDPVGHKLILIEDQAHPLIGGFQLEIPIAGTVPAPLKPGRRRQRQAVLPHMPEIDQNRRIFQSADILLQRQVFEVGFQFAATSRSNSSWRARFSATISSGARATKSGLFSFLQHLVDLFLYARHFFLQSFPFRLDIDGIMHIQSELAQSPDASQQVSRKRIRNTQRCSDAPETGLFQDFRDTSSLSSRALDRRAPHPAGRLGSIFISARSERIAPIRSIRSCIFCAASGFSAHFPRRGKFLHHDGFPLVRYLLPDFLGDERHERMQHPQAR